MKDSKRYGLGFTNPNYRPADSFDSHKIDANETLPVVVASEKIYRNLARLSQKALRLEQELKNAHQTVREGIQGRYNDPLTNCLNRSFLELYKSQIFNPETDDNQVAVLFFDINNLKLVNDKHGHEAGDKLIKDTAEFLKNTFNGQDNSSVLEAIFDYSLSADPIKLRKTALQQNSVIRLGGDEFLAICPNIEAAPDFQNKLNDKFDAINKNNPVDIASGMAFYDGQLDKFNFSNTMARADQAMYISKKASKLNKSTTRSQY